MTTESAIERKLKTVFNKNQATVLAKVITDSYQELVKSDDLRGSQKRSEQKLDELGTSPDQRFNELILEIREGLKNLSHKIFVLGGTYDEAYFRTIILEMMTKQQGVTVTTGYYAGRQVDLIIRDSEHIILEITSRMKASDINKILASGEDYKNKHGIKPVLMVATSYISPKLMQKIIDLPKKIELFSYEAEED